MIDVMRQAARSAGEAILEVYGEADFGIETKSDDSPLTRADLAAHHRILSALNKAFPEIPVLSEESDHITFETRRHWQQFFMVDPLDGTKEFISRNGEFTVNIALIESGEPVLGVVYVPVTGVLFAGDRTNGTAFREEAGETREIKTRPLDPDSGLTVVASRRHGGEALARCLALLDEHFDSVHTTNMGSSLKFCLIASGEADFYPRLAPTSEWDTAAAQAIVESAGGRVVDLTLVPLRYNQRAEILNPYFYVMGDPAYDWASILKRIEP